MSPCRDACPVYFEIKIRYGVKYCRAPCRDDQFYFPQNKSCLDACPHTLKVMSEAGANFCGVPCSNTGGFIFDDESCQKSCPMPLRIEEGKYCKSPCMKENEYVNLNGDCQETCEYPFTIVNRGPYKICQIDLRRVQWAQVAEMREIVKISNILNELGGILSCLMKIGNPTSLLMLPFFDMFQKIISTEVLLPRKTELILDQFSLEGPGAEQRILSSEKWKLQKSFNERVVIMAIFSVIALLTSGLLKLIRSSNESKFYQLIGKLDVALRWKTSIP